MNDNPPRSMVLPINPEEVNPFSNKCQSNKKKSMKGVAMWTLAQLNNSKNCTTEINGRRVPARPENYKPRMCPVWKRVWYAWQVIKGKAETFTWPEGQ